ncbi:uncharacterized protein BJ212DRAFT_1305117 [Suillus subaureus]|uniref:Uncharacterized protein n=1 Tax=Suillus subaureus TaxID=48587 RepID=A0A9P7DRD1_9AGAM|nr:uncharacterized protein BJ212DRAFT_1305117 [Suillus subaureus]KAG1801205.1 hypothetical protein BJ212DRAFT_1305117 [Suillus subaureus]
MSTASSTVTCQFLDVAGLSSLKELDCEHQSGENKTSEFANVRHCWHRLLPDTPSQNGNIAVQEQKSWHFRVSHLVTSLVLVLLFSGPVADTTTDNGTMLVCKCHGWREAFSSASQHSKTSLCSALGTSSFSLQAKHGHVYIVMVTDAFSPGFNNETRFKLSFDPTKLVIMPPYKATSKQLTSSKEQKLEKQKKRVLKTAYQGNPEVFETEPLELHSDADREEDTMFSDHSMQTKLSNAKVLTFSAGKIPIASHTISGSACRLTTHQDAKLQKVDDTTSNESGDLDDPDSLESHISAADTEPTYQYQG